MRAQKYKGNPIITYFLRINAACSGSREKIVRLFSIIRRIKQLFIYIIILFIYFRLAELIGLKTN